MGMIDAPVSGGVGGAEKGTLVVMAGGRPGDIERARPVVMLLAQRFTRMGDAGAGQVTKLCNQIIVGSLLPVLAEAVRLAEAAGVDARRLAEALKGGSADSIPLQVFGARMAARDFEPPLAARSTRTPLCWWNCFPERADRRKEAGLVPRFCLHWPFHPVHRTLRRAMILLALARICAQPFALCAVREQTSRPSSLSGLS